MTGVAWVQRVRRLTHGEGLRAQLLRGGGGSLLVKAGNVVLAFLLAVVLARTLGPEGYGVYAFAFAIVTLLAIPAQAGIPHLVVRETAKTLASEQWGLMKGLWRWSARYILLFSLAVGGGAASAIWWFAEVIDPARAVVILLGLLLVPLLAFSQALGAAVRGLGHVVWGQVPDALMRPLFLLVLILALWLIADTPLTPVIAIAMHAAAAAAALVLAWSLLRLKRPHRISGCEGSAPDTLAWRRAVIPLALVTGLQVINAQADILILGLFRDDNEVGVYRVVVQMSLLVAFGLAALTQVVQPHFARLFSQGEMRALQRLVTQSSRTILLLAAIPAVLFLVAGEWLLSSIFGPAYGAGAMPLAILVMGQIVSASFGSVGALLNMTGHERDTMKGMAIALVANLVLNLALVPTYGAVGAALGTALSFLIWNMVLRGFVRKRLGLESWAIPVRWPGGS